ncbi:hypothetical protein CAPTEDRAFT_217118 [Capitella teleta]|uniref:Uncharacterized protein n=1 Tax=Capitella teleta TaxID=283909 RepID=R7VK73_CAPTE|nr:hypothetical protein CAPTEDRAFT_217118 [Capitella teleta]|eukprot:ELU17096.1 hypothetical protein CAPTEDRAFT_217118 [Capitella teleta]
MEAISNDVEDNLASSLNNSVQRFGPRAKSALTIDDVQSISGFTFDSHKASLNSLLSLPDDAEKKLPVLDLSKIQQKSEENVGDTGIKKVSNLEANVKQASTNQRAETEEASGGLNLLSARSTTSARSALSFGADKSEWSDDDSVLSSPHEAKKPSLAQLHQQRQSDDWQKDVVPPERRNEPVKKNSLNISYEEENVSLKATSSSPTKMSPEKHKITKTTVANSSEGTMRHVGFGENN